MKRIWNTRPMKAPLQWNQEQEIQWKKASTSMRMLRSVKLAQKKSWSLNIWRMPHGDNSARPIPTWIKKRKKPKPKVAVLWTMRGSVLVPLHTTPKPSTIPRNDQRDSCMMKFVMQRNEKPETSEAILREREEMRKIAGSVSRAGENLKLRKAKTNWNIENRKPKSSWGEIAEEICTTVEKHM